MHNPDTDLFTDCILPVGMVLVGEYKDVRIKINKFTLPFIGWFQVSFIAWIDFVYRCYVHVKLVLRIARHGNGGRHLQIY